jgi:hypothetical protein
MALCRPRPTTSPSTLIDAARPTCSPRVSPCLRLARTFRHRNVTAWRARRAPCKVQRPPDSPRSRDPSPLRAARGHHPHPRRLASLATPVRPAREGVHARADVSPSRLRPWVPCRLAFNVARATPPHLRPSVQISTFPICSPAPPLFAQLHINTSGKIFGEDEKKENNQSLRPGCKLRSLYFFIVF